MNSGFLGILVWTSCMLVKRHAVIASTDCCSLVEAVTVWFRVGMAALAHGALAELGHTRPGGLNFEQWGCRGQQWHRSCLVEEELRD